jgi:transcriptional regulator with XRE-family HTH domain
MLETSLLQQAREAANLTVEQIANQTNIRAAVIRDLENNSVEQSGGIAYARGHLRAIVKLINQKLAKSKNIDADEIVAQFQAAQALDNRRIIDKLDENNVAEKPKEKKRMKFGTLASISAAVLTIGFIAQIAINNVSGMNENLSSTITQSSKKPTEGKTETSITLPAGVNLVISGVGGRSWVGLTNANGESVFNGQIGVGEVMAFNDPQMIKAVIGNAGAVALKVNGADLGVVGANGEVVRLDFGANQSL